MPLYYRLMMYWGMMCAGDGYFTVAQPMWPRVGGDSAGNAVMAHLKAL